MVFFFALIDSEAGNKCTGVFYFFHSVLNWTSFYFFLLKVSYIKYTCVYTNTHKEIKHNKIKFTNDKKKNTIYTEKTVEKDPQKLLFFLV